MTAEKKDDLLLKNATKAMRNAVRGVVKDCKMRGQPVIVWKDGKVVRLHPDEVLK